MDSHRESPDEGDDVTQTVSVGVDVGGSFTDVVFSAGSKTVRAKAPTNPADFSEGVLAALQLIAEQEQVDIRGLLARVDRMGLGTTAVTNVIAALAGSTVGLLTTQGFEDELALSGGIRPSDGDGRVNAPVQLVPRRRIIGLDERIDRFGAVLSPLDPRQAVKAARALVDEHQVGALAVSLMSSYGNPAHERAATAAIRAELPELPVLVSTELTPVIGFFQRTVFTVLNAYAAASLDGVEEFLQAVRALGLSAPLRLVNAAGGAIGVQAARRVPMTLMHSGPAAGVSAAAAIALARGLPRVIACDMGGTSFDVSVVNDGRPLRKLNAQILQVPTSMSVVDVQSIGSGGGSIGWVDARGMLRVGPRSARSTPGPACYARGGTEPTVTDALLVLGYIDADHFLGGSMRLEPAAAEQACAKVGAQIGLSAQQVARGIVSLALADMVAAVRLVLNRRGLNARDYGLISYGGCGSLFTAEIARQLGVRRVVVPEVASVLSAYGAATAPVRHERSQSLATEMPVDPVRFETVLAELTAAVSKDLDDDHVPPLDREISVEADLRYKRQRFDLSVPVPETQGSQAAISALEAAFYASYTEVYGTGSSQLGAPVELVTLRVAGRGLAPSVGEIGRPDDAPAATSSPAATGTRAVWMTGVAAPVQVSVFDGGALAGGSRITGPACVDKVDTTIWIPAGATAATRDDGSMLIDLSQVHDDVRESEA
jgi:N-methylhydantoinase A